MLLCPGWAGEYNAGITTLICTGCDLQGAVWIIPYLISASETSSARVLASSDLCVPFPLFRDYRDRLVYIYSARIDFGRHPGSRAWCWTWEWRWANNTLMISLRWKTYRTVLLSCAGLGRLAACYLDSGASMELPLWWVKVQNEWPSDLFIHFLHVLKSSSEQTHYSPISGVMVWDIPMVSSNSLLRLMDPNSKRTSHYR